MLNNYEDALIDNLVQCSNELEVWVNHKEWYEYSHNSIFSYGIQNFSILIKTNKLKQYRVTPPQEYEKLDLLLIESIMHILKKYDFPKLSFVSTARTLSYNKQTKCYYARRS